METPRQTSEPPFTAEDVTRMVEHMNDDHADSVLAYVRHFGGWPEAERATLLDVSPAAMRIHAADACGARDVEIAFDHRLESGHDAHMTMVKMSKSAKRALEMP